MPTESSEQAAPHDELGLAIKRARERAGMTQKDMADRLGINRASVANWERGVSYPGRHGGAVEQLLGITIPRRPAA